MKAKTAVLMALIVGVMGLESIPAHADIFKHAVRMGAYVFFTYPGRVPVTSSGDTAVFFSGSGKFSIWYTAECAASGYVNVDILVDGVPLGPTGANVEDSFCDGNTRDAMHTVTGRTASLDSGTHRVEIVASTSEGAAYLSDSSLLIGK